MKQKKNILIVTGGSRGIGKSVVEEALKKNWEVAIGYNSNKEKANEISEKSCGMAKIFEIDLESKDSIEKFFNNIVKEMGMPSGLVNSGGVFQINDWIKDFDFNKLDKMMKINVTGLLFCCSQFAKIASVSNGGNGGCIVNVSSMAPTIGGRSGNSSYAASKGAVDVFTAGAAKELAKEKIKVFAVRPAVTRTDMAKDRLADEKTEASINKSIAIGRVAEPHEIARPIMELFSESFNYASGSIINLSGGGFVV